MDLNATHNASKLVLRHVAQDAAPKKEKRMRDAQQKKEKDEREKERKKNERAKALAQAQRDKGLKENLQDRKQRFCPAPCPKVRELTNLPLCVFQDDKLLKIN